MASRLEKLFGRPDFKLAEGASSSRRPIARAAARANAMTLGKRPFARVEQTNRKISGKLRARNQPPMADLKMGPKGADRTFAPRARSRAREYDRRPLHS